MRLDVFGSSMFILPASSPCFLIPRSYRVRSLCFPPEVPRIRFLRGCPPRSLQAHVHRGGQRSQRQWRAVAAARSRGGLNSDLTDAEGGPCSRIPYQQPQTNPNAPWDCHTAEKRPGVVPGGSMGRQSYGSPMECLGVVLHDLCCRFFAFSSTPEAWTSFCGRPRNRV